MADIRPVVGSDLNQWGAELLALLGVTMNPDGTTKVPSSDAFSRIGVLSVVTGVGRSLLINSAVIIGAVAAVNTAPTGAAIICDVNKNGTTIFTTQGNRPTIAAGANATSAMPTPNVTALQPGDYLSVDIDQVGSNVAGSDLVVKVFYRITS